jgi:hypothetical protein
VGPQYVTLVATWIFKWLLDFLKICGHCRILPVCLTIDDTRMYVCVCVCVCMCECVYNRIYSMFCNISVSVRIGIIDWHYAYSSHIEFHQNSINGLLCAWKSTFMTTYVRLYYGSVWLKMCFLSTFSLKCQIFNNSLNGLFVNADRLQMARMTST